jgi:hypothetical protein
LCNPDSSSLNSEVFSAGTLWPARKTFKKWTNTPPAKQAIDKLISAIENLDDDNVPQSVKTSLTVPSKEASNILNDDNPNNDESACGKLGAFINQVNAAAERRNNNGTMTADQADDLRTQAEDIRDELLVC